MYSRSERGQAVVLALVGISAFIIAAMGLALDGSTLFAQHQMAQTAADAAAQAAALSVFDGTNTSGTAAFSTGSSFTCTTTDARTPCTYAALNGFGTIASDTVTVSFPGSATGVTLSGDAVPVLKVTVQRAVPTTLMRLFGTATTTVQATATAALVNVPSPVPLVVTHPTMANAISMGGTTTIRLCGGTGQSIQVNSSSASAYTGGGTIDLSHAGPADGGQCTTGTGADFGTWGGPATKPGSITLGTTGHYDQPSSPIQDPLANVSPPAKPSAHAANTALADGVGGCPASPRKSCMLYHPGLYSSGINVHNETAVFAPGIYYMDSSSGFQSGANGDMYMCSSSYCTADTTTGSGMLVYNKGGGTFNVGSNGSATLVGTPIDSAYKGMLFFEDRSAPAATHVLGGGGCLSLLGTIYLNNPLATMLADSTHYQTLEYHGNPCSTTYTEGDVIVNALVLKGTADLAMKLRPDSYLRIRKVALVQ
jgi:hypothetical protein